jgi:hypothetical protein
MSPINRENASTNTTIYTNKHIILSNVQTRTIIVAVSGSGSTASMVFRSKKVDNLSATTGTEYSLHNGSPEIRSLKYTT